MLLNNVRRRVVRWLLVTAVLTALIAAPLSISPAYAGDCESVATASCGG